METEMNFPEIEISNSVSAIKGIFEAEEGTAGDTASLEKTKVKKTSANYFPL